MGYYLLSIADEKMDICSEKIAIDMDNAKHGDSELSTIDTKGISIRNITQALQISATVVTIPLFLYSKRWHSDGSATEHESSILTCIRRRSRISYCYDKCCIDNHHPRVHESLPWTYPPKSDHRNLYRGRESHTSASTTEPDTSNWYRGTYLSLYRSTMGAVHRPSAEVTVSLC